MKKQLALFYLLICLITRADAQSIGDTLWTFNWGADSLRESANSIVGCSDGGFIIAGEQGVEQAQNSWIFLLKLDGNGNKLWNKSIEINPTGKENVKKIRALSDGNFGLAGESYLSGLGWQLLAIKINTDGDTLWTNNVGGPTLETGYDLCSTENGGFAVIGSSNKNGAYGFYLVKFNSNGDTLWTKIYQAPFHCYGYNINRTNDGGFILAGLIGTLFNSDIYIIKTDSLGNTIWTSTINTSTQGDESRAVFQVADNGFIVCGVSNYNLIFGNGDVLLAKVDSVGNLLWTKILGGQTIDLAEDAVITNDGNLLITGMTTSYATNSTTDLWTICTDSKGDTLWTKTYGKAGFSTWGKGVCNTLDNGFAIASYYNNSSAQNQNALILRLKGEITDIDENEFEYSPDDFYLSQNYPNPFNPVTIINYQIPKSGKVVLKIFDMLGKEIAVVINEQKEVGRYSVNFDASKLSSGVYMYQLQLGDNILTKKMILMR